MEEKKKPQFMRYLKYFELGLSGLIVLEIIFVSLLNPGILNLHVNNHVISYFTLYITSLVLLIVMLSRTVLNLTLFKSVDKAYLSNNFRVLLGIIGSLTVIYFISTVFSLNSKFGFIGYYNNLGPNATMWFSLTILTTSLFVNTYREKKITGLINDVLTYILSGTVLSLLILVVIDLIRIDSFTVEAFRDQFAVDTNFILLIVFASFVFSFFKIFNSKRDLEKYIAITTIIISSILYTVFSYQLTILAFFVGLVVFAYLLRNNGAQRNLVLLFTIVLTSIQFLTLFTGLSALKSVNKNLPVQESINITTESLQNNPLTGAGANTFLDSFWKYRSRNYNETEYYNQYFDKPSSEVVLVVHDLGIPGLFIIVITAFLLFRTLFSAKTSDQFTDANKYLVLVFGLSVFFVFSSASIFGYLALSAFLTLFLSNADDYFKRQNIVNFSTNTVVETIPPEKNVSSSISMILNSIIIVSIFALILITFNQFNFAAKYISNENTINYTRSQFRQRNLETETLNEIVNKQRELILDVNNIADRGDYPNEYALMNISIAKLIIDNNEELEDFETLISTLIESSVASTNKAVELYPDSVEEWRTRGTIYATMSEFRGNASDIAISSYIKAAQISPNDPNLRLNLGKLYLLDQQNEDAIEQLSKAVRLKNDLYEARALLIRVYDEEDNLIDAFDHIKYFVDNVPVENEYYQDVTDIIQRYQEEVQVQQQGQ